MKKAQFDFDDYLDTMEQMRNMGGISSILNMLPGVGAKMKGQDLESMVDEKDMARKEAIVLSMTPKERENPDLINPSRKQRIAKGAGVDIAEVNRIIKQFEQIKKDDETDVRHDGSVRVVKEEDSNFPFNIKDKNINK